MIGSSGPLSYRTVLVVAVLTMVTLVSPQHSRCGRIYKFVDGDGVIHFTNVPNRVQYRSVRLTVVPMWKPSKRVDPKAYDSWIREACRKYGIDCRLVKAVIKAESGFNPNAVSPKGARGLMQLMPQTARYLGLSDVFDPHQNIMGGVRYLKELLMRFDNNLLLTLAAFNAGPEKVEKYGGIPPYKETRTYLRKVLTYYVQSL